MSEPVQPASHTNAAASNHTDTPRPTSPPPIRTQSVETGEETIRRAVVSWFGPLVPADSTARAGKHEHHETILETLLRLHAVSCSLVAADKRLPLPEQDVLATIQILNYIAVTLHCPPRVIASRCAVRSLREQSLRANQLDPLQIRHLLTIQPNTGPVPKNPCDFAPLTLACRQPDFHAIHAWFETIARTKSTLPRDTPQLLRQLATDLWEGGHHDFFETFVTELAVLDARMFETAGWENTRQYFAIFKRVHGLACRFASSFLKPEDIALAAAFYEQLGDTAEAGHFRELSRTYDAPAFRRFESTVLAAAKENNSRNPFETASASPFASHAPFPVPGQPSASRAHPPAG